MDTPTSKLHLDKKLGPLPRKTWVAIIGVGVIGGLWWRAHNAKAAAATATTPPAGDPTMSTAPVDPNVDPNTGLTWAEEAAQQAAAAGGFGGGGGVAGNGSGIDPNTGVPFADEGPPQTNQPAASPVVNITVKEKSRTKHKSQGHGSRKGKPTQNAVPLHRGSNPPRKGHHTDHHPAPSRRRQPVHKHQRHR